MSKTLRAEIQCRCGRQGSFVLNGEDKHACECGAISTYQPSQHRIVHTLPTSTVKATFTVVARPKLNSEAP